MRFKLPSPGKFQSLVGLCSVLFLALTSAAQTTLPAFDAAAFRADVQTLASHRSRLVGSSGYQSAGAYLEAQLAALPNVEWKKHEYRVMTPITKSATIAVPGGATTEIFPFWPAHIRHNATPAEGITGNLVYIKGRSFADFPPQSLFGAIAVLEADNVSSWQNAAYFGARAVVVLGSDQLTHVELRAMDLSLPINVPRFYLPAGALADSMRAGSIKTPVTLKAEINWESRPAANYYALVMGRSKRPAEGWDAKWNNPSALCIAVPYDASGLVPDLAAGAGQAVQTAAALSILRDAARQPLERPILIAFTGADSLNYRGTRELLMALAEIPSTWNEQLAELNAEQAVARADAAKLAAAASDPTQLNVVKDRTAIDRIAKIIEVDTILDQDRLFKIRSAERRMTDEMAAEREILEARQIAYGTMRYAFQRNPKDLTGDLLPGARQYIAKALARLHGEGQNPGLIQQNEDRRVQLQQRLDLYNWLAGKLDRPRNPRERDADYRLIEVLMGLDLADAGVRVGPMYFGFGYSIGSQGSIQNYRDWLINLDRAAKVKDIAAIKDDKERQRAQDARWFANLKGRFEVGVFIDGRKEQSYLSGTYTNASELAAGWGVPGFSLMTYDDARLRRDTPADTLANLKLEAIEPQLAATREVILRAWNDAKFHVQQDFRFQRNSITGQCVSPASGRPVPDLPRPGFLATYYYSDGSVRKVPRFRWLPWIAGVRRSEVVACDAEGKYRFEGLPRHSGNLSTFALQVYDVQPDTGAITGTTDVGKQAGDINMFADIRTQLDLKRSVVFKCVEYSIIGLYDPRFLQALGELTPLDARRNSEPQRYNMMLRDQMLAAFVEPDMLSALVFRYGRVGNRLLLLNVDADAKGKSAVADMSRGFTTQQMRNLGPLSLQTAIDFNSLDAKRLADYREAGVSNSLIDSLHNQAKDQIAAARQAIAADDGAELVKQANGAWANETRVYQAAQDMASDVIRAAIFLLLLCVPFAFCMERLLIGTPNIYKQIGGLSAIFAIMAAALWVFHPAFKISSSPLIIILSFAILFMSITVIWVVYGKFDTELKRIRSGRGNAEGASFARASVLMSAVLLGIANMRKRKFRTGLTALTIVLITFAVLCFTSTSSFLDTTTLPTGQSKQYSGLMLRQRGFRPMPPSTVQNLEVLIPKVRIVERWWNVSASEPRDMIHIVKPLPNAAPRVFAATAALGLSPGESKLSNIAKVIGEEKFSRLENGEKNIIYFSNAIAEQLKVVEGDTVKVGGMDLQVAGVFSADEFDQRVTMLSGEQIAPLKYTSGALDASGRRLDNNEAESLDLDADSSSSELASAYEHLPATQFVIWPAQISRMLNNSTLRSLAFELPITASTLSVLPEKQLRDIAKRERIEGFETRPLNELAAAVAEKQQVGLNDESAINDTLVKTLSDDLSKRLAVAMFAGFTDGVKMVSAGSGLPQVSGAGQVAVPLAIAGLIIFNTMMGSIAERRREIHVYTSLGLAPMHVGALFVAEALTYGLIGAVFGYVIGQGVGTLMSNLGLLGSVTLNYSGTSAMVTMGLILLIVLLSALVPARLASKIAAPSIERTWKVPLPKGDEILAVLPFTINKTAADGALAYLADFFDAHREGSIGKFSAGKVDAFVYGDDTNKQSRGLKTVIWLTPFDLGVRQHLMLLIHPGSFPDVYEVQVVLNRLSGDDGNWYRMNRSFLTELRKQFLQWRSLSPQRQLEYVEQSRKLFAAGTVEVVPTMPGEQVRLA